MKVKYIRWSTLQQTGARQLLDSKEYDLLLQEQISGSVKFADRPKGKELLRLIRSGVVKELHVEELTRLGRNAHDTVTTLQICEEGSVNVVILNMHLHSIVNDKPNSVFKMITYLLATIGEQEKENIKERTEAGKIAARNKGVIFGRPAGTNENVKAFLDKEDNKKIARLLKEDKYSIRQIAAITETSNTTVQKVKKMITPQVPASPAR